jgi:hypothetical protein
MTTNLLQHAALRLHWLTNLTAAIQARRGSRVIAIQCTTCRTWVNPRRFHTSAMQCRTCHHGPDTRTWHRTHQAAS